MGYRLPNSISALVFDANGTPTLDAMTTCNATKEMGARMQVRLGPALRAGQLSFDGGSRVLQVVNNGQLLHSFPYASLTPSQWGYVYERHVGLWFEAQGYSVIYRGLELGFVDSGIDLVLTKDDETIYVQCKHALGQPLTTSRIRWLLYKADAFLAKECRGRRLHFHLVVPDKAICFSSTKMKINGTVRRVSVARYFEEHNTVQHRVKLCVVEVPMPLAGCQALPLESELADRQA